jgi:rifampin ADP-ribosylating transferase
MDEGYVGDADDPRPKRFYHGTRAALEPGDLIEPGDALDANEAVRIAAYVFLTQNLDEAIWEAEIAAGDGPARD